MLTLKYIKQSNYDNTRKATNVIMDDNSGVVMKRSRVKAAEMPKQTQEDLQLTLPLHQIPI